MNIFGKPLSAYFAFQKPILILILIVGGARLGLTLSGVSDAIVTWLSITAVAVVGIIYVGVKVARSGFGSYKHLLPICVLQSLTAQVIIVPAIILAIFTGHDNIYSAPEFSFGSDGKTWGHVAAHLFIGTTVGSVMGWLAGCLIMFAAKKLVTKRKDAQAAMLA